MDAWLRELDGDDGELTKGRRRGGGNVEWRWRSGGNPPRASYGLQDVHFVAGDGGSVDKEQRRRSLTREYSWRSPGKDRAALGLEARIK
jgi:hypothetical protein